MFMSNKNKIILMKKIIKNICSLDKMRIKNNFSPQKNQFMYNKVKSFRYHFA